MLVGLGLFICLFVWCLFTCSFVLVVGSFARLHVWVSLSLCLFDYLLVCLFGYWFCLSVCLFVYRFIYLFVCSFVQLLVFWSFGCCLFVRLSSCWMPIVWCSLVRSLASLFVCLVLGHMLPSVGCWVLSVACWLSAIGVCLFVCCCLVLYHFGWLVVVVYCLLFVGCRLLFAAVVCRSVFVCLFVGLSVDSFLVVGCWFIWLLVCVVAWFVCLSVCLVRVYLFVCLFVRGLVVVCLSDWLSGCSLLVVGYCRCCYCGFLFVWLTVGGCVGRWSLVCLGVG